MNDLKRNLVKFTGTITKTSGEFIKSTKLSISVASEEENLKSLYIEIGKKVHEIYAYGGSLGKFFDEKYDELLSQENKIREMKDQLEQIKGVQTCVKCGKTVDRNAEFCPKCGIRMGEEFYEPISAPTPTPLPGQNAAVTVGKICNVCAKENEANAKFCLFCGRMLN